MTRVTAYLETRVLTASPVDLVAMSYEFATLRVHEARIALAKGEIAARSTAISKATAILAELDSSLDYALGGEIATNLGKLYGYMRTRLIQANLRQTEEPLAEVESLLDTLASAWRAIGAGAYNQPETPAEAAVPAEWSAFALAVPGAGYSGHTWSA